ncbi:zinc transporter, putative [Pediculus humanus corporis]|uniref:Zinc transporter, putative n=1 Tax=Pediculus humanus subsp. corporis TaxID=121224 RepID=E0VCM4_PEDHC|nr:zinc transporter, putative [Pediculus humanus corporis]EEB11130.1 zinc transporter, putative [Pediculus humanus corporis]
MSTRFYDIPNGDDTVRLLSNPLNNENLQVDEFEFSEEARLNNSASCSGCCSSLPQETSNISINCLENDLSVQTSHSNHNGDCHNGHHFMPTHLHNQSSSRLLLALCLCIIFMAAEMIGGYIAGSVAVVSDGAHLLTDVIGFLISLIAIATSKKKSTKNFNLGFYRIEILATLSSILLIWIMTAVLIYIATIRLVGGDYSIEINTMIIISSLGVVINILMFSVLHDCCHTNHIHSHPMSVKEKSKSNQNINVQAAIIHVIGDLVQSVGVFISSIIIKFYPEAKFMDPVCTFLFSIIVICSTLKLLKNSVYILMDGFPNNIEYNNILMSLQSLNGVRHVHSLCVWSLTVGKNVLIVHLAVDDTADRDLILFQAQRIVSTKFGIKNHTIQIEKYHSKCMQPRQEFGHLWS